MSDKFFHELTVFTAAMIAQITDLRRFQMLKIDHATEARVNKALPPGVRVPAIKVKLSDILQRPGSTGARAGKGPSWALDSVRIMFLGIRNGAQVKPPDKDEATSGSAADQPAHNEHKLTTLVDARFKVADPERFSMLNCNVERDVVFNKQLGVFALHLQTELGTPIYEILKRRLQAIERLVDCVDAIRRCDRDVRCEKITLQKITFSYSQFSKTEAGAQRKEPIKRWIATLDLSADEIQLHLEKNDPQLRIIDVYHQLLNSDLRFGQLPYFLSITSPLQSALDTIEAAWTGLTCDNKGRVEVYATHLDCFNIHYVLPGADEGSERRAVLRVQLKERKNNLFWWVFRGEPGAIKNPDDVFKKALESVWGAAGREWRNLGSGAACPLGNGIETLLKAVDDAVRPLALQSPKAIRQSISNVSGGAKNQKSGVTTVQAKAQQNHNNSTNAKARPQQHPPAGEVVVLD